ncbi:S1 family serine peptidase [Sinorhizobium psoraleae]|uniref:Serine protease n=1 Tax=Sinorhizobium psoraleae TaxID=520838 RepID=A0ABT4K9S3_9HYPH|nr:serine protease [Sinorhizobium psoraleae]MCZ4088714.1 serine protease [Sinorhizobium psoraleae]
MPKIINGKSARVGMFPWVVSIGSGGAQSFLGHECGGTLITDKFILTAAHCFLDSARPEDFRVQMGAVTLSKYTDKPAVRRILFQKNFNRATNEADIALLELIAPVVRSPEVSWIGIQDRQSFDNSGHETASPRIKYTLTGFGFIATGDLPVQLQYADDIPSLTTAECHAIKVWNKAIMADTLKPDMICAGDTSNVEGSDACKGDSGGGLIFTKDGTKLVAGVASRGALPDGSLDCTQQPLRVGVYTRISAYAAEIEMCVKGIEPCSFVPPGQQVFAADN